MRCTGADQLQLRYHPNISFWVQIAVRFVVEYRQNMDNVVKETLRKELFFVMKL
jgi:hypothetical protein